MKLFAVFLVVLIALTPPAFAAESATPTTAALFAQHYPLTRSVLAADFPQDLQALERSFSEKIDGTGVSSLSKLQLVFLKLTALRQSYAPTLQFARSDTSALLVLALADFYRSVLRRDGSAACGAFAADGAGTLYSAGTALAYGQQLDRQGALYFSALASALEDADVVGPVTEDDWNQVMGQIVADGHPVSYIASIALAKVSDPDLCPALSAFMQAMIELRSDAARRVRADFIQNVARY